MRYFPPSENRTFRTDHPMGILYYIPNTTPTQPFPVMIPPPPQCHRCLSANHFSADVGMSYCLFRTWRLEHGLIQSSPLHFSLSNGRRLINRSWTLGVVCGINEALGLGRILLLLRRLWEKGVADVFQLAFLSRAYPRGLPQDSQYWLNYMTDSTPQQSTSTTYVSQTWFRPQGHGIQTPLSPSLEFGYSGGGLQGYSSWVSPLARSQGSEKGYTTRRGRHSCCTNPKPRIWTTTTAQRDGADEQHPQRYARFVLASKVHLLYAHAIPLCWERDPSGWSRDGHDHHDPQHPHLHPGGEYCSAKWGASV